jgi:Protein of unknown function (DUF3617)
VWLLGAFLATPADTGPLPFAPGLYEIEVRLGLPNVLEVAPPRRLLRCLTASEIESGRVFFVRSENPIRACALADYEATGTTVRYRISCLGPNAASAEAEFETSAGGYRGAIRMQMGGKNMTMSETQVAVRVGECEGERP